MAVFGMQAARRARRPASALLSWPRCLLLVSLAAGVALAISYREAWKQPLLTHAWTAQAQLHARYRAAEAVLQEKLPVWQRTAGRVLAEQRWAFVWRSAPAPSEAVQQVSACGPVSAA